MDYFFCYNKSVSDFLFTKEIRYITVAKDVKTDKIFALFEITPQFQKTLAEYKTYSK